MDKIDSRTLPVDALNRRRRRAVKLRLDGTSLKKTAAQCEMSRTTMIAAMKAYEAGGWKAVEVDRGGRPVGSGRTLSTEQELEVQRLIRDRTPGQLRMVYALWTRQAVAELIRDRYGIKLAVRTIGPYLRRWGFTPQKPMKQAAGARVCNELSAWRASSIRLRNRGSATSPRTISLVLLGRLGSQPSSCLSARRDLGQVPNRFLSKAQIGRILRAGQRPRNLLPGFDCIG